MKNSSQTQHCRSEARRKEEHKIQTKWSVAQIGCEIVSARTVHLMHCSPLQSLFTFLTLWLFVTIFCFLPFYPCNSFWFCFFLVISYTLSTYISLNLYKLSINQKIDGRSFQLSRFFSSLPHFLSFSFLFFGQPNTL